MSFPSTEQLVLELSQASAFPEPVVDVTVRQTHISNVFIAGEVVYKVKKPVKLSFLDFSTVELRHHFCEEEVRINQPWAPNVYLGVVPITHDSNGLRFEGHGPVIDWAVKMRRLPESATLRARLVDGSLQISDLDHIARRIAALHDRSTPLEGKLASAANADFRRCWQDNWDFASRLNSNIIEPSVLKRLLKLSEATMQQHKATLEKRAFNGWIREVHGDLRLEHIYYFPQQPAPNDIVILDGIEFSSTLRHIDVVADIAFLLMELSFVGRRDLARHFADIYYSESAAESADGSRREVLPLFTVYRSAIRAKVAAIFAGEAEIQQSDREKAVARSQSHWLWCLSELEQPDQRPALVLVSGLPGTGKSTLSRMLANAGDFEILRSDVIRKEFFPRADSTPLYSADKTQRVYDECWIRARQRLLAGGRVIVDATFQGEANRQRFLQLAIDSGIRTVWLECTASEEITKLRLDARQGDASDADWTVYGLVQKQWEPPSDFTKRFHHEVPAGESSDATFSVACDQLKSHGLWGGLCPGEGSS